ncbi:MAG TPA: cysteine desulfurase CsdA [Cryomorphaceae bacterium]|nr:cysteine desulfurase CsdA [Cryomorphaceae bacterium]
MSISLDTKTFNVEKIREEFPILHQKVNGRPLVYFDNAATTQKPKAVIDAISRYYSTINSNVHRGVHHLSQLATQAMEDSRLTLQKHINARESYEVIFTQGTTDSINLVAIALQRSGLIKSGDEIMVSALEHHSNIVPWQMLCEQSGARLVVIPMNEKGELSVEEYRALLNEKTRLVAFNHISNALGTVNPVKEMVKMAHNVDALTFIDGAQATPHMAVDVQHLDTDFYALSGHKVYGPTGIGVLYGKEDILEKLAPYRCGGEMIESVSFEKTTYAGLPHKFEAGTPHIEGAIVLGTAIDFLNEVGVENIAAHEADLVHYGIERLSSVEGMRFIGEARNRAGLISFVIEGVHPYDVGVLLDKMGIALRTGHHCAQPVMAYYKIPGTLRASFAMYNTRAEIDLMMEGLEKALQMLR